MSDHSLELADASGARQSNLAFALGGLSKERQADAIVFYDFCRVVDDIADSTTLSPEEKTLWLKRWKNALATREGLPPALLRLIEKYHLDGNLLIEIILGVEMDIAPQYYQTYADLRAYCWRVASAVGLVSIEIFGCRSAQSKVYAEHLGQALQLTNIIRDVAEDAAMGRIYLPLEDLQKFGITTNELLQGIPGPNFLPLMQHEAQRASALFEQARRTLPPEDAAALLPAEIMHVFYEKLLRRMTADGFRVFQKRYRLGKLEKLWTLLYARFTASRRVGIT